MSTVYARGMSPPSLKHPQAKAMKTWHTRRTYDMGMCGLPIVDECHETIPADAKFCSKCTLHLRRQGREPVRAPRSP